MGSPPSQHPRFHRIALPLVVIVTLALFFYWPIVRGALRTYQPTGEREGGVVELATSADDSLLPLLRGNPGDPTMDRLQPHLSYLTAGKGSGMTNQVWSIINMLYLSYLTGRIAILPSFWANTQLLSATHPRNLPIGDVFDLPRLQLEVPLLRGVLEWQDVHPHSSDWPNAEERLTFPQIGCWGGLRKDVGFLFSKLEPVWTPYPGFARSSSDTRYLSWVSFVPYLTPNSVFYQSFVSRLPTSTTEIPTLPPNDHLACIDEVLSGSELENPDPYAEFVNGLGGWLYIGKHMHFREVLVEQATIVLRKIFEVGNDEEVPPFIAIHIRHGDFFRYWCPKDATQPCFTISQYAYELDRLQEDIVASGFPSTTHVLVLTDELDDAFYAEVKERGWKTSRDGRGVDDSVLRKALSGWYPTILDKVLMALASHFIGTDRSTMSVLSARRVQDWNNGMTRMVGPKGPGLALTGETSVWSPH